MKGFWLHVVSMSENSSEFEIQPSQIRCQIKFMTRSECKMVLLHVAYSFEFPEEVEIRHIRWRGQEGVGVMECVAYLQERLTRLMIKLRIN